MFRQVVLPASLPAIFNGLRIAHGFAWILIVVGEMTGVPTGLGSVIMDGRTLSRTDLVITGMIVIGVCGLHHRPHHRRDQQPRCCAGARSIMREPARRPSSPIRGVTKRFAVGDDEIEALRAHRSRRSTRASSSA